MQLFTDTVPSPGPPTPPGVSVHTPPPGNQEYTEREICGEDVASSTNIVLKVSRADQQAFRKIVQIGNLPFFQLLDLVDTQGANAQKLRREEPLLTVSSRLLEHHD